jgi:SAM-dependent methyltransferase
VRHPGRELEQLLASAVPSDHARQTLAEHYIEREPGRDADGSWRVLDLGCGPGDSIDFFRARDPGVEWVGLDLPDPHIRPSRTDARFETYGGDSIPFDDGSFDFVYCKQVLEHARRPVPLLTEVHRVLVPGGYLAGSTSQLEPFHTLSLFNYTPLGVKQLLEESGLQLVEVRPGIDGLTLISRRLFPRRRPFDELWGRWWGRRSPLNTVIDAYGRVRGWDARTLNATKLVLCGQFAFLARRVQ